MAAFSVLGGMPHLQDFDGLLADAVRDEIVFVDDEFTDVRSLAGSSQKRKGGESIGLLANALC